MKKGIVIAVANQKGGVTKTTTCRYLADVYASQGKKILMIDCDPQASLTKGYQIDPKMLEGENDSNICNIFRKKKVNIVSLDEYNENIHLLPANKELGTMSDSSIIGKDLMLRNFIEDSNLREHYDIILMDNNPKFDTMTINSILSADVYVVPVGTTKDDQEGLQGFFDNTEEALSSYGHKISKIICIPSRYNTVTNVAKDYLDIIKNDVEPYINENCPTLAKAKYKTTQPIPEAVPFQEASSYNMSCYKYLRSYGPYSSLKRKKQDDLIETMEKIAKKIIN